MTQAPPPGPENDPGGYPSTPPPQPADPGQQAGYPAAPPPPGYQTPQQGYPAAPPPPAGNYGQPAPGAYGQPPAPAGGSQISFDASKVTNADWAFFGVGVLMLIFSFFGWFSVSYTGEAAAYGIGGGSVGGWNGWWTIIQLLLLATLVIRAVQVFTGNLRKEIPGIAQVAAVGLIILLTVIALIQSFANGGDYGSDSAGISAGPGFGIWAYLILAVVLGYLLTLVKQKEGPLPFKVPSIAGL